MRVNIAKQDRLHEHGYRYTRDTIDVVHENFKGAITRIVNLATIAKQLQSPVNDLEKGFVKHVKKLLGLSTCAPLTFPGYRDAQQFDKILQTMIEKYILCPKCVLPEWNGQNCAACGYNKTKEKSSSTTKTQTLESITECVNLTAENEPWVVELSTYMQKLYDRRIMALKQKQDVAELDRQLDTCWMITTESTYVKLKSRFETQ